MPHGERAPCPRGPSPRNILAMRRGTCWTDCRVESALIHSSQPQAWFISSQHQNTAIQQQSLCGGTCPQVGSGARSNAPTTIACTIKREPFATCPASQADGVHNSMLPKQSPCCRPGCAWASFGQLALVQAVQQPRAKRPPLERRTNAAQAKAPAMSSQRSPNWWRLGAVQWEEASHLSHNNWQLDAIRCKHPTRSRLFCRAILFAEGAQESKPPCN